MFGCLMANFFETSIALGASKSPALAKTLNLIAGIDILLMVAYFGVLLALRAAVLGPAAILPFLRGRDPRRKPGGETGHVSYCFQARRRQAHRGCRLERFKEVKNGRRG